MPRPALPMILLMTLGATPALAHSGHDVTGSLLHGLAHPLLGTDHLMAMVAVGLWSGFALTRHRWRGAAAFLVAMAGGAGLGWAGVPLPGVETAIALSVMVLGLCVLTAARDQDRGRTAAALVLIAGFALFHGHAHATEASGAAGGYVTGFLTTTAALHLAGLGLARGLARAGAATAVQRLLGAGLAAAGLWMTV
jgi:urease accessory protein